VLGVLLAWVVAGLAGAFAVYLAAGSEGDALLDPAGTLTHNAVPALAALVLIVGVVSWLRWWPVVLHDDVPARRWAWAFPVGLALGGAAAVDWSRLSDAGLALVVALAVSTLAVAASEELAFRGFLLRAMRDRYSELAAALITTFAFGLAHMLNGGLSNVAQGLLTLMAGFVFYAARRVSGGIVVPILLHAWWDFCVFSAELGPGAAEASSLFTAAVILLILFLVSLLGYRLWQPRPSDSTAA
jgi:membrane protease YdiL (CAAX protease family)